VPTYVRLRVAGEAYAIPVGQVLEVADPGEVVAVPRAPREVTGVRNLRGRLLPVVDLARVLGVEPTAPARRLLVADVDGQQAGLLADEVSGVAELAGATEDTESELLQGAVLADGELIGLLDLAAILRLLAPAGEPP